MIKSKMLSKDLIPKIALELDIVYLNNLCRSSKQFNKLICDSQLFWRKKLLRDFPNVDISHVKIKKMKDLYKYLSKKPKVIHTFIGKYLTGYDTYNFIERITYDLLRDFPLEPGDVIIFDDDRYKTYIWSGEKFYIDYLDDYFILPFQFEFPKYPPQYWYDLFDEESTYIDEKLVEEAIKNVVNNKSYITGTFGERYEILNSYGRDLIKHLSDDVHFVLFTDYRAELF